MSCSCSRHARFDTLPFVAKHLTRWNKVGRFVSGLVIACFFLPFFGISCDGMDVITFSGTDMIGGYKPGGFLTEKDQGASGRHNDLEMKVEETPREPLAIAAFTIVLVSFGLAWIRTRGALQASLPALALNRSIET